MAIECLVYPSTFFGYLLFYGQSFGGGSPLLDVNIKHCLLIIKDLADVAEFFMGRNPFESPFKWMVCNEPPRITAHYKHEYRPLYP